MEMTSVSIEKQYTLFYKRLRSGPSTESFLAFGDLKYSMFLNSFLTWFYIVCFTYLGTTFKFNKNQLGTISAHVT